MMKHFCTIFVMAATLMVAGIAFAQSDPFGALDRMYLDSLRAYPGQDITVKVNLFNDEQLGALQVPLKYDTSVLKIRAISYMGSRVEYIQTKITNPPSMDSIGGRFMVAIIRISESHPIPAGDGLIMSLQFTVSTAAIAGSVTLIDTLAYPPSGSLVLSEQSGVSIRPTFKAGKVVITPVNRPPQFAAISPPSVREGDSLKIPITAVDPDSDKVTLTATSLPQGAQFIPGTNGNGTAVWVPDFIGPFSSTGSPFKFSFQASDGKLTTVQDVFVTVINVDRPPKMAVPATATVEAGKPLSLAVSATDPDQDSLTIKMITSPTGAVYDNKNPGQFSWVPPVTDSGLRAVTFVATDPLRMTDTGRIAITVHATTLYTMALDTTSAYPGDTAVVRLSLDNKQPVSGFNLFLGYDPSILSVVRTTQIGTRVAAFEYYSVTLDEGGTPGLMRIIGTAALSGVGTPLAVGAGPITSITFRVASNLDFVGMNAPVRFLFQDAALNDNTLKDQAGAKIPQSSIVYNPGFVSVRSFGTVVPGDINLNGIPNDVGDVVYLSNYLMNPVKYPLNLLQYANADVNGDGISASVADLVRLINNLINGVTVGKTEAGTLLQGSFAVSESVAGETFSYEAPTSVGGILVAFETDDQLENVQTTKISDFMKVETRQEGQLVRVLVYSTEAKTMASGQHEFVTLAGIHHMRNLHVDASSGEGNVMTLALTAGGTTLPTGYALYQNYPNPFNPQTQIEYDLPAAGEVTLAIFDVLGRQVRIMASGNMPAGRHAVMWDGRTDDGNMVASGLYFYRLQAATWSQSRKMILLK